MIKKNAFIDMNRQKWEKLVNLTQKKRRTYTETEEMGTLYQNTIEDLSYAQTHFPESDAAVYLNQVIRRCHLLFYQPQKNRLSRIGEFLLKDLPALFIRLKVPLLVSFFVFVLTGLLAFSMVLANQEMAEMFLDSQTLEMAKNDLENHRQFGNFDDIPASARVPLSFFLWVNNSRVALFCFVLGITFGLGTFYILTMNGLMLGALTAFYFMNGYVVDFLSLIMIHGSIELLAIIIAGGAGFNLAGGLFLPGRLPRKERLKLNTRHAFYCLVGVIIMLLLAGLIEGIITPMKLLLPFRIIIASLNVTLIALYFIWGTVVFKAKYKNSPLFA
ncbi:MAG: stage II sporulation protein M [Spirochaetales bacterium]|nr:stage II sporulation protein M [Spirochaetales bacterium]